MKLLLLSLVVVLSVWAASPQARTTIVRPGIRQADQAEAQTERNIPPPIQQRTSMDLAKLGQEADELASIAQTIPPDIASVQKGMLPKDVILKLKQIEKLSKRLRSKLDR